MAVIRRVARAGSGKLPGCARSVRFEQSKSPAFRRPSIVISVGTGRVRSAQANALARRRVMKANASAILQKLILCAAVATVVLTALPAAYADDTIDCTPATCTSPILGPGHHEDVETR